MEETVQLTQLYKTAEPEYIMATCQLHSSDDRFECKIKGDINTKNQLWQFVQGNWKGLTAVVEFDDVTSSGLPKYATVVSVRGFNPIPANP